MLKRWKRRYWALWDGHMLYRFRSSEDCDRFFDGSNSRNTADKVVNLDEILGVRESTLGRLPGRGIDLVGIDGSTRTLVVEHDSAGSGSFAAWYRMLRDAVGEKNRRVHEVTHDPELLQDVGNVEPRRLQDGTAEVLQHLCDAIASGNVNALTQQQSSGVAGFSGSDMVSMSRAAGMAAAGTLGTAAGMPRR